jgi:hypothetical protein
MIVDAPPEETPRAGDDSHVGDLRTRVVGGKCVFSSSNGCLLHETPEYPTVCRGFPWTNEKGEAPYVGDLHICPELRGAEGEARR